MGNRYYSGQIGAVYLTHDGTASGVPCRLEVTGDDAFSDDLGETITVAADSTLHSQSIVLNKRARELEIKILFCSTALYASLQTAVQATRGTTATVRVQLSSVKRVIDVLAKANGNNWLSTGKFSGTVIQDVTLRLVSVGPGV